jgi:hypothetical protein
MPTYPFDPLMYIKLVAEYILVKLTFALESLLSAAPTSKYTVLSGPFVTKFKAVF